MTPAPLAPERLERIANLERPACGDNSCRFTRPTGMGTNGGCRCLKVGLPDERVTVRRLCLLAMAVPDLLSHIAYLEGEVEKLEKPSAWRVLRYFYQRGIAPRQLVADAFGEMNVHILRGLVHELCEFANFYPNGPRQTPDPSEPGA